MRDRSHARARALPRASLLACLRARAGGMQRGAVDQARAQGRAARDQGGRDPEDRASTCRTHRSAGPTRASRPESTSTSASALASRLGLTTTFVDVKPSEAATALAEGKVDVVLLGALRRGVAVSDVTLAGSYLSDGPAFFIATESTAAVVPSMTLDTLPAIKIGAQEGSPAFWRLQSEFGAESLVGLPDAAGRTQRRCAWARSVSRPVTRSSAGYIIRDMPDGSLRGAARACGSARGRCGTRQRGAGRRRAQRAGRALGATASSTPSGPSGSATLPKLKLPESADASASTEASATP